MGFARAFRTVPFNGSGSGRGGCWNDPQLKGRRDLAWLGVPSASAWLVVQRGSGCLFLSLGSGELKSLGSAGGNPVIFE